MHLAGAGFVDARHHSTQCGFAATGLSDQTHHFSGHHMQVHMVYRVHHFLALASAEQIGQARRCVQWFDETFGNVVQLDDGRGHGVTDGSRGDGSAPSCCWSWW